MSVILGLINKYIKRNEDVLNNDNVLHSMHDIVLTKSSDADYKLDTVLLKEVYEYCLEQGYKIDRVVFWKSLDSDVGRLENGLQFDTDSRIVISKKGDETIAKVFFGGWLKLKGENNGSNL